MSDGFGNLCLLFFQFLATPLLLLLVLSAIAKVVKTAILSRIVLLRYNTQVATICVTTISARAGLLVQCGFRYAKPTFR